MRVRPFEGSVDPQGQEAGLTLGGEQLKAQLCHGRPVYRFPNGTLVDIKITLQNDLHRSSRVACKSIYSWSLYWACFYMGTVWHNRTVSLECVMLADWWSCFYEFGLNLHGIAEASPHYDCKLQIETWSVAREGFQLDPR